MPKGNKVADSAVQCDSDRNRALACSCTVTPGRDKRLIDVEPHVGRSCLLDGGG